jgi:hypothetical protein
MSDYTSKRFKPAFHRFGHTEYVETGSTATNLVRYGVSVLSTDGSYVLDSPTEGVVKYLVLETSGVVVQTHSTAVGIGGSTNQNEINATTNLNTPEMIMLIGQNTTAWLLGTLASTGWALADSTGVN